MSGKSEQLYSSALDQLPDLASLEYFLADFEMAQRNAIERRYPHVQVIVCFSGAVTELLEELIKKF